MAPRLPRFVLSLALAGVLAVRAVDVRAEDEGADVPAAEAPAISITPARGSTQIAHPPGRRWKLGERACLPNGKCGVVRMVTRDYAVVESERPKAKAPKKRKRETAAEQEEEPLPPPKPPEPEPPSSFSNVAPEDSIALPTDAPPPGPPSVPAATTKRKRPPKSGFTARPKPHFRGSEWYAHVQLNATGALRESGAKFFSPELSWDPMWEFEGTFRIRGHFGAYVLKAVPDSYFPVLEPAVFASFGLGMVRLEPGAGMNVWIGQGGFFPLLQMNVAVSFEGVEDAPRFFERVFVAGGVVFTTKVPTFLMKGGFGFTW